jgi:Tfp pilus assembly protein PilF
MHICERCHQAAKQRCSRCLASWYCSRKCQKLHWAEGHRHKCAEALRAAPVEPVPAEGAAEEGAEQCAICLYAQQQPLGGPCGHSFCRTCVINLCRHGVQSCPVCRTSVDWEVIAADPQDANAHMGDVLRLRGDMAGAEAAYRAAIAAGPQHAKAHSNLGVILSGRGDKAGAEAAYRASIAADPQCADAHFNLGILLKQRGDLAGEEAAYRAAIAAYPQHTKAHFNLGILLKRRGDLAGAEAAYRAVSAADPQHAKAHHNLGLVLQKRGDLEGAAAAFVKVVQLDPSYPHARLHLTRALSAMRQERNRE